MPYYKNLTLLSNGIMISQYAWQISPSLTVHYEEGKTTFPKQKWAPLFVYSSLALAERYNTVSDAIWEVEIGPIYQGRIKGLRLALEEVLTPKQVKEFWKSGTVNDLRPYQTSHIRRLEDGFILTEWVRPIQEIEPAREVYTGAMAQW